MRLYDVQNLLYSDRHSIQNPKTKTGLHTGKKNERTYGPIGPGDTYPPYGIAQTGKTERVLGKSQDGTWKCVRADPKVIGNGYAWVATAYTQPSNIERAPVVDAHSQPPSVAVEPPPSFAATATAIDYVNLDSAPGTNYLLLGTVAPGTTGEVTGKSQDGLW